MALCVVPWLFQIRGQNHRRQNNDSELPLQDQRSQPRKALEARVEGDQSVVPRNRKRGKVGIGPIRIGKGLRICRSPQRFIQIRLVEEYHVVVSRQGFIVPPDFWKGKGFSAHSRIAGCQPEEAKHRHPAESDFGCPLSRPIADGPGVGGVIDIEEGEPEIDVRQIEARNLPTPPQFRRLCGWE